MADKAQRFLRIPEVVRRTGISRSGIYERLADGTFPQPVKLGKRSVAFVESEIDEWMAQRIKESRKTEAA